MKNKKKNKKNKKNKYIIDCLKAVKSQNRSTEIELHNKPINYSHVQKSKKTYTRKAKHKNIDKAEKI